MRSPTEGVALEASALTQSDRHLMMCSCSPSAPWRLEVASCTKLFNASEQVIRLSGSSRSSSLMMSENSLFSFLVLDAVPIKLWMAEPDPARRFSQSLFDFPVDTGGNWVTFGSFKLILKLRFAALPTLASTSPDREDDK